MALQDYLTQLHKKLDFVEQDAGAMIQLPLFYTRFLDLVEARRSRAGQPGTGRGDRALHHVRDQALHQGLSTSPGGAGSAGPPPAPPSEQETPGVAEPGVTAAVTRRKDAVSGRGKQGEMEGSGCGRNPTLVTAGSQGFCHSAKD